MDQVLTTLPFKLSDIGGIVDCGRGMEEGTQRPM
jgi:hypothetical protein